MVLTQKCKEALFLPFVCDCEFQEVDRNRISIEDDDSGELSLWARQVMSSVDVNIQQNQILDAQVVLVANNFYQEKSTRNENIFRIEDRVVILHCSVILKAIQEQLGTKP